MQRQVKTTPRKRPRQARSKATVDTILAATARVLVKQGFDGLTTNAVAEAAGVSIGSLYQYFPNKEALVAALIERHVEEMNAAMLARARAGRDAADARGGARGDRADDPRARARARAPSRAHRAGPARRPARAPARARRDLPPHGRGLLAARKHELAIARSRSRRVHAASRRSRRSPTAPRSSHPSGCEIRASSTRPPLLVTRYLGVAAN